jgi:hypothetical protein
MSTGCVTQGTVLAIELFYNPREKAGIQYLNRKSRNTEKGHSAKEQYETLPAASTNK